MHSVASQYHIPFFDSSVVQDNLDPVSLFDEISYATTKANQ